MLHCGFALACHPLSQPLLGLNTDPRRPSGSNGRRLVEGHGGVRGGRFKILIFMPVPPLQRRCRRLQGGYRGAWHLPRP
jgi:hypothetical protein